MRSDIAHDGAHAATDTNIVRPCCCRTIHRIPFERRVCKRFWLLGVQTSIDCIEVSVFASSANGTFLFYDHSISDLNTGFLLQDTSGFGTIPNQRATRFQVEL
jgi:hypothetical protein